MRRSGVTQAFGNRRRVSGVSAQLLPTGSVNAIATLAGTSTIGFPGSGSVAASATLSGAGTGSAIGTGSLSASASLAGTSTVTGTLFAQVATGTTLNDDNEPYTMGVQFSVTVAGTLTAIWWYSAATATVLPQTIALYLTTGTLVTSQSATWSGAAGSGWVRAPFTSPPSLSTSTNYKGCILMSTAATKFYSSTVSYWSTGAGASGITNGYITAPNTGSSVNGQCSYFQGSTLTYPNSSFSGSNYWVDVEVTT